ncbi:MAG: hypothetical protein KDD69_17600 [Bdellovibrionales bacterium]|nr:hypothetical protein [Bdellovibrionales bacterium]
MEHQSESIVERSVSPSSLGWFLGVLTAMTLLSVFYVGDLVSTGIHHVLVYRQLEQRLSESDRPDLALDDSALAPLPEGQAQVLKRAAGVFALLHDGEDERVRELLATEAIPASAAKYKLSAVLSWAADNKQAAHENRERRAAAENRRRGLVLKFGEELVVLAEQQRIARLHAAAGFGGTPADAVGAEAPENPATPSPEQLALHEYRTAADEIAEFDLLYAQITARNEELRRMSLERARSLISELARPVFDEQTLAAYREASVHAERVGWPLPQMKAL